MHTRIIMIGGTANPARDNWLYKTESALLDGLELTALPGEEKSRLVFLLGVEYAGFTDTGISLETAVRHLFEFRDCLAASPDSAE